MSILSISSFVQRRVSIKSIVLGSRSSIYWRPWFKDELVFTQLFLVQVRVFYCRPLFKDKLVFTRSSLVKRRVSSQSVVLGLKTGKYLISSP